MSENKSLSSTGSNKGDKPGIDGVDKRTPSPPFGYSRLCLYTEDQQIAIVAEFHANRIKPNRIAYRTGIDIAFVQQLITGECYPAVFKRLLVQYRRGRRAQRVNSALKLNGCARFELQAEAEKEYQATVESEGPSHRIIKTLSRH